METSHTIELTSSAVEKLKEIRGEDPERAVLRLFVLGRTCCGYRHGLRFAAEPDAGEGVIDVAGVPVAVALDEPPYSSGATIDYLDSSEGVGFVVRTPGSSGVCACHTR